MKIVSAEVKLIPRPPALVESRNTKCGELGAGKRKKKVESHEWLVILE